MIELDGWTVRREDGRFTVGPVDVTLEDGEMWAVIGPNGAGKTSLLRGLFAELPSRGRLRLDGRALEPGSPAWLREVGYVPDARDELLQEMSAAEYWRFLIRARGVPLRSRPAMTAIDHAEELAARLHLHPHPRTPIAEYSLGMTTKTQLVAALFLQPRLLALDEPRNGLDPFGIEALHDILDEVRSSGAVVLVCTHDLEWAHRHAQRCLLLRGGRVRATVRSEDVDETSRFTEMVLEALA